MEFVTGQLIIILAPYIDQEIYTSIKSVSKDNLILTVKGVNILKPDKDLLCIAINGGNIFEFYSRVLESYENTIHILKPIKNELNEAEKRRFNRMDCNIGFIGRPVMINDLMITQMDKQFSGTIRNISAGGVLIETSLKLPPYMIFKFKLKLNYFMDCTAIIRRSGESEMEGIYQAGCEFMDMSMEDIKTISLFVFKEQLKNRRKELNKNTLTKDKGAK